MFNITEGVSRLEKDKTSFSIDPEKVSAKLREFADLIDSGEVYLQGLCQDDHSQIDDFRTNNFTVTYAEKSGG